MMEMSSKQPTQTPCQPRARGYLLDDAEDAFGALIPYEGDRTSKASMDEQLKHYGYLYMPCFHDRQAVQATRHAICRVMQDQGLLDPSADFADCVPNPSLSLGLGGDKGSANYDQIAAQCAPLQELLYGNRVMDFFEALVGGRPRNYDYTWFRAVAPGLGTVPHCDIVYMGRGTHQVYTRWTPLGDISLQMGGLMVLENSHTPAVQDRLLKYTSRDVDEYCSNRSLPTHVDLESEVDNKVWNGWLARNPVTLRKNLRGRWLTTEYSMGDVLIFPINLVHASLDNQSDRFRLSTDSRYQCADLPVDQRFIGSGPLGHTGAAKRGRVC